MLLLATSATFSFVLSGFHFHLVFSRAFIEHKEELTKIHPEAKSSVRFAISVYSVRLC